MGANSEGARRWRATAALFMAASLGGCSLVTPAEGVRAQPENPNAIGPMAVVAEGSGAGGDYRAWAFHTSDGMACVEVASTGGSNGTCDPRGGPPLGGGVGRSERGVVVWALTANPQAVAAVLHDSSGAIVPVSLVRDQGLGINVALVSLGPASDPVSMDFMNAIGAKLEAVALR